MLYGNHIYATAADIDMSTMCSYPPSQHSLPHRKCVLLCCNNFKHIAFPYQKSDMHQSITPTSLHFHIYHWIADCTVQGQSQISEKKIRVLCLQYQYTVTPENIYTRKELVMRETSITKFHTSFYILTIKKLVFHRPQIIILGTNHCGNTSCEVFKHCRENKYVFCLCAYF